MQRYNHDEALKYGGYVTGIFLKMSHSGLFFFIFVYS